MKYNFILLVFCLAFFNSPCFSQGGEFKNEELENFILITDQDHYLAGDRVWFAAKLLKNHESYRYSKLAFIVVLDAKGKPIHQEKMLLSGQNMIYGDLFIPEPSPSGVYSFLVYSKWMANFDDFPVAKKEFLVSNPSLIKPEGEPALFWEQIPIKNAPISLFHTSEKDEVIEIQDKDGNTLEIIEAVAPMQKVLSKVKNPAGYRLIFRNREFEIEPEKWLWDPSDFTLVSNGERGDFKIITHTDWMILEEAKLEVGRFLLDKSKYEQLTSFKISVLDGSDQLIWSYQVQLPSQLGGHVQVSSRGKTGEVLKLEMVGFPARIRDGIILAGDMEDPLIVDFVEILNHPNWKNLTGNTVKPNLVSALGDEVQNPLLLKDYSPMFDYKLWSADIFTRFPGSVQSPHFSFSLPDELYQARINQRVYREHFEIGEEVVGLQSPFAADKVYQLEDYEEFTDMETLLKEIVPQVRLKKSSIGSGREIFIANTDNQNTKFDKKPLILIDFYKPASMEDVWKLDLISLDRIELYYNRSTVEATNLGEAAGDGLIIFFTKNNQYFLKNNRPKESYFLSDVSVPRSPDYSGSNPGMVSANPLQFMDPGITFFRGKSKSGNLVFDTAGNWLVEAWLFGNSEVEKIQKRIQIDP